MGDEGGHKFTVNDPELGDITFPGSVYDTPELIATLVTDDMEEYHGTHTAGITAGCITPQGYGGMAPEADLVLIPHHELTSEEFADRNEDDFMELALAFVAAYADHSQHTPFHDISFHHLLFSLNSSLIPANEPITLVASKGR